MNLLLLIILVFLFFVSYEVCGRDFFAPATMMCMSFAGCYCCALYLLPKWKFNLSAECVGLITFSLIITILINLLIHTSYKNVAYKELEKKISPISDTVIWIFTAFTILVALLIVKNVVRISGVSGTFAQAMLVYRSEAAYSGDTSKQLPGYITQLLKIAKCFSYILGFNLILFNNEIKKRERLLCFLSIAVYIITSILTGGRFGSAVFVLGLLFCYHVVKIRKNKTRKVISTFTVIKVVFGIILFLFAFYMVRNMIGRDDDSGFLEYIAHYLGGGIPNFDMFLKEPPIGSSIWGKETFYSLNNGLRKLGLANFDFYIVHKEFRFSNGHSMGNIYIAIRDYIYDFGYIGMVLLQILFSVIVSVLYEKSKKNLSSYGIIIVMLVYGFNPMYAIANHFFANAISIGYTIECVEIFVMYQLFLVKKPKFTLGKKKYRLALKTNRM